jgi:hypothetical protein
VAEEKRLGTQQEQTLETPALDWLSSINESVDSMDFEIEGYK